MMLTKQRNVYGLNVISYHSKKALKNNLEKKSGEFCFIVRIKVVSSKASSSFGNMYLNIGIYERKTVKEFTATDRF